MAAPIQLSRKKAAKDPYLRWRCFSEFLSFADVATLTPVQSVAYLASEYETAVVDLGGHEYYFSLRQIDCPEVVSALLTVGAKEQAAILTSVLEAIRVASERAPQKYANRFLAGLDFADLTEFDEAVHRCVRSISHCLLEYLDRNESEFIAWQP